MKFNNLISICLFLIFFSCTQDDKSSQVESILEIFNIETGKRRVVYQTQKLFEAPNWSRDGEFLLYNSEGMIWSIPVSGGEPEIINTGFALRNNNDHGISPDNTEIVISHHEESTGNSIIYIVPLQGGSPRQITGKGPSYWHGWSPDGNTLVYCAERNGEFDIYSIPVEGGEEKRLTDAPGLDDGPDFSPDGEWIWFNSVRTGTMQIWRMRPDGSDQQQMTFDESHDWFPHPSPDGKWVVFLSYEKDVDGHPANKNVKLRMISAERGEVRELTSLFGGQGTINVPSWSPDSKEFAFVSYKLSK